MGGTTFEAIWLGIVQGLTEFLPVSSSGHLALFQLWFGTAEPSLALSVLVHFGTLLATVVFFRKAVVNILLEAWRGMQEPSRFRTTRGGRDTVFVVVASVPTAMIGFFLRDWVEGLMASPVALGVCFLVTGALLISTRWARDRGKDAPSWPGALFVGFVQGAAVLPGISRSGSTITGALWLGVKRERAFELSMLMSIPAVLGALILELEHLAETGVADGLLFVGLLSAAVSFVVGLGALLVLRTFVTRGYLAAFAFWVVPLGIAVLVWGR